MKHVRRNLIDKIKKDTGFKVHNDWKFERPTLNWAHKSAGRMAWYWYTDKGVIVGSCENMNTLLKSKKIEIGTMHGGFVEFFSD
jgi:hypothetical protein